MNQGRHALVVLVRCSLPRSVRVLANGAVQLGLALLRDHAPCPQLRVGEVIQSPPPIGLELQFGWSRHAYRSDSVVAPGEQPSVVCLPDVVPVLNEIFLGVPLGPHLDHDLPSMLHGVVVLCNDGSQNSLSPDLASAPAIRASQEQGIAHGEIFERWLAMLPEVPFDVTPYVPVGLVMVPWLIPEPSHLPDCMPSNECEHRRERQPNVGGLPGMDQDLHQAHRPSTGRQETAETSGPGQPASAAPGVKSSRSSSKIQAQLFAWRPESTMVRPWSGPDPVGSSRIE